MSAGRTAMGDTGWLRAIDACTKIARDYQDNAVKQQVEADKRDEVILQRPALVASVIEAHIRHIRSMEPATPAPSPMVTEEEIARVLDPIAFTKIAAAEDLKAPKHFYQNYINRRDDALKLGRAVLALLRSPRDQGGGT